MKLKDRIAVVTGAGQGIGRAVCLALAREGAKVVASDLNESNAKMTAEAVQSTYGTETDALKIDVGNIDDIQKLISYVTGKYGRIDILINNAGICPLSVIEDITVDEWDLVMSVNLRSVFFMCQAAAPIMKVQNEGCILNLGSIAGKTGGAAVSPHYAVSKAGVICMTKTFAKALAPFNVRVNALAPGPIDTPMVESFGTQVRENYLKSIPLGRLGEAEDVAEAAVFLVSDSAKFITGETMDINGGMFID